MPLLLSLEEWRERGEAGQKHCPGTLILWGEGAAQSTL